MRAFSKYSDKIISVAGGLSAGLFMYGFLSVNLAVAITGIALLVLSVVAAVFSK